MATVMRATGVKSYEMFIGGAWVQAQSGDTYEVVNPASEEVIA